LANFHPHADVCVVSDQRGDGTPVLFLPRHCEFVLHYGPHSARRHLEEAGRRGLSCQIVSGSPWGIDIDEPEDLSLLP
jgi:2-phospho-L-lactate guanylyltransferase (CobY/MobA/RfbA family)